MSKSSYENFTISAHFELSLRFTELKITDFAAAVKYIQHLPYGRNSDGRSLMRVLDEQVGTCSTKHALLHTLCMENGIQGFDLVLCIFNMNPVNTPRVADVLRKYRLPYIPEAHTFIRYKTIIIDVTFPKTDLAYVKDIVTEEVINANDIGPYKVQFHKAYIKKWLAESKEKAITKYTADQIWEIREECIAALSDLAVIV